MGLPIIAAVERISSLNREYFQPLHKEQIVRSLVFRVC